MKPLQQESIPANNYRGNLRVIVAEQETAAREALVERIHDTLGVTADACNTARAVEKILQSHPDETVLAVVDTRLPDAPNGEVLDLLTQAKIPSIAISPKVTPEVADRLVDRYIVDCILKRDDEDLDFIADLVERTLLNHTRKILLLSTSDFSRGPIRQMLDIHRYTVIDVRNAREVRRQLANHPQTSLVLLDQSALDLDLISELRQRYRKEDLAIAAVCEQRDPTLNARLLRAGLNDVICRPHHADEFYYRVRHCVESVERVRDIKFSATHDRLTGLHNREFLFEHGEKSHASARRGENAMAMALIQIDSFNDLTLTRGHDKTDALLQTLAATVQKELRRNDCIARYNTATFACVTNGVRKNNAQMVFERLRQIIRNTTIATPGGSVRVSASIGVETALHDSFSLMLASAHSALQQAIDEGGNRICVAGSEPVSG